jgi:choline-sulfatase
MEAADSDMSGLREKIEYQMMKKHDLSPETVENELPEDAYQNIKPQHDEPEILQEFLDQRTFKRHIAENYTEGDWLAHRYIYKKLTEEVDRQIGRVLDALEGSRYSDNTLIVFTSDHGDMDGTHRLEHKTVMYEQAINIPLILSHKSLDQNVKSDILCSNSLDLFPTLLNFVGIELPDDVLGTNILSVYNNEAEERRYLPIEGEIGRCIVTKDYKYVLYDYGKNNEQLYDYRNDSEEMYNHINEKENENIVNELRNVFDSTWSREQRERNVSPLKHGPLGF